MEPPTKHIFRVNINFREMIHNFRTFHTSFHLTTWFEFKIFSSKFGVKKNFWKTFSGGGVIFLGGSKFEFKKLFWKKFLEAT